MHEYIPATPAQWRSPDLEVGYLGQKFPNGIQDIRLVRSGSKAASSQNTHSAADNCIFQAV